MKLNELRKLLIKYKADGLFIRSEPMKYYLELPTGSGCNYYLTADELFMFYDSRYKKEALECKGDCSLMPIKKGVSPIIEAIYKLSKNKTILLESDVSYTFTKKLAKVGGVFQVLGDELTDLRMIKTPEELEIVSKAVELTDQILDEVIREIKLGMTEQELLAILVYKSYQHGAEDLSFKPIITFGERTALPHGRPTNKKLKQTDPIMIDFGIKYQGFESDLTRMFFWEKPTRQMEEIYQIVRKAQESAIKAIAPNVKGSEIDRVARNKIEKNNYGDYFVHGLGHGVGIDNSVEGPILNENSDTRIQNNMVMTVEPGVYLEDIGGVRIEDVVVCIDGQPKVLSKFTKEIFVLTDRKGS